MNNDQYLDEEEEKEVNKKSLNDIIKIIQNRITYIYMACKFHYNYNSSKFSNSTIVRYIPNDKDFSLFILDFLSLQKNFEKKMILKDILKDEISKKIYQILTEKKQNYKEYIEDMSFYQDKININIVFIGMEHAGKSTTIGHLLYSTKNINDFQEFSFRYAWIADKRQIERESGHTYRISTRKLETEKYYFSLINIQGKKNLIKNAIKGIFMGDAAIIIVPAVGFESIFSDNQSFKDQVLAAYVMGIRQVIVAISKMIYVIILKKYI
jgi:elongation factor 1-alpha